MKRSFWFSVAILFASSACANFREADEDRTILGRPWFDTYPKKHTDVVFVGIWLPGGLGAFDTGSAWRYTINIFEFERQRNRVFMTYLQDNEKEEITFKVTPCDERPPFDLCLDLTPLKGTSRRLYSWGDLEDAKHHVPWMYRKIKELSPTK